MKDRGFETKSLRMQRVLEVSVFAPEADADRTMTRVCQITPLSQGLDDGDNPHRWWNTTGDWTKAGAAG